MNRKFTKAVVFAWVPLLFLIAPILFGIFSSISNNKATGLGAVAGGLSEGLATFGLVAIIACEVYAMILFVRTFSGGSLLTRFVAIVSIGCAVFYLLFLFVFLGWLRFATAH